MNSSTEPSLGQSHNLLRKMQRRQRFLSWGLSILCGVFAVYLVYSHSEMRALRAEVAKRLQSGDRVGTEAKTIARTAQDAVAVLQAQMVAVQEKQEEAENQQTSLAQLYQELARSRDDRTLAEIEQVLSTANQQLSLSGNIGGALVALENADRSLARSGKSRFADLRAALARDTERLKGVPHVDLEILALQLDEVIGEIDRLPLVSNGKIADGQDTIFSSEEVVHFEFSLHPADWAKASALAWNAWIDDMRQEMHRLVRVQEVDLPQALMLSPTQAYYVRENLKLRLLSARLSLLSRSVRSFGNDMDVALATLGLYFDGSSSRVKQADATLRQIKNSELAVSVPDLSESLTVLQSYRLRN